MRKVQKTNKLLNTFIYSAIIYLLLQEMLNIFIFVYQKEYKFSTFVHDSIYFYTPLFSLILSLTAYLILRGFYKPKSEHFLLHGLSWSIFFFPQIIPAFYTSFNMSYIVWTFILSTTAAGTIVFQDFVLIDIKDIAKEKYEFYYNELKFYIDKLMLAWLTLGSVIAVIMTITWTAKTEFVNMDYFERLFFAVYSVFSFIGVTALIALFVGYPLFINLKRLRDEILKEK